MRNASIIMLIVAAVLGALAVFGVNTLMNAQPGASTQPAAQPQQEMATVVVARRAMEFGTEITPELLREIPWAVADRPEGSFNSIDEILTGERRVALRAIAPGEVVLSDRISGFGGRAALSRIIEDGKVAVAMRVNDVTGTAGFILPSDYVDVLLTINPGGDSIQSTITDVILRNVRVLAIDQLANENQDGAVLVRAVVLELEIDDAQRVQLASTIGSLSLALRNITDAAEGESERVRTIRYSDLAPRQEEEARPQPARRVARAPVRRAPSPYTNMIVTRGLTSSTERVIRDRSPASNQLAGSGGQ